MVRLPIALVVLITISAFSLAGSATDALAAQPQPKQQCYKEETCMKACFQAGANACGIWCERRRRQWPPC